MNTFREALYEDHGQTLAIGEVLYRGRTEHQDAFVFTNPTFGKVLTLDGVVQLTGRDNHIYHEMIVHVPLTAHGAARDVLIIGGGDGGTLREVLKHPVAGACLVELDPQVVELSRRFFPEVSNGAFDDPRAAIVFGDGAAFVARTDKRFDVIIVDSTDPIGPGEVLFSDRFYADCRRLLRPRGLIAVQSGAPFYRAAQLQRMLARLQACFGAARAYLAPVPTYAHGLLALMIAGPRDNFAPARPVLRRRFAKVSAATRYYTPEVHRAAFVMGPRFEEEARESVAGAAGPVTAPAAAQHSEPAAPAPGTAR
ncbi:MAG TPA: polyamine aminopropyltransferase [Xanthobacteraceae bacterium]|nr:polyamine aminopropyltransferase [Xanthobacteraceae bacterium]